MQYIRKKNRVSFELLKNPLILTGIWHNDAIITSEM